MKKIQSLMMGAAFTLAASGALAAGHAHYGMPTPAMANLSGTVAARAAVPLVITNNTTQQYNVKLKQADGSSDRMPIQSVNNYPYNVISINDPAWPVHVEIFTMNGQEFFNQWIQPQDPNVKINSSNSLAGAKGIIATPSVTTSSTQ